MSMDIKMTLYMSLGSMPHRMTSANCQSLFERYGRLIDAERASHENWI